MKKFIIIMVVLLLIASTAYTQTTLVWRNLRGYPVDLMALPQRVTDLEARVSGIETQLATLDERLAALETANLSDDTILIGASVLLTAIGWADLAGYQESTIRFKVSDFVLGNTYYSDNGDEIIWTQEYVDHWTSKANELETAINQVGLFTSAFNQKLIDMPGNDRTTLIEELQRIEAAIGSGIDRILLQE
jgi:hypothetical protein